MKHFATFLDFSLNEIRALITRAAEIKSGSRPRAIEGKILGMLFFIPSLRTRVSFEAAMMRFGGSAISLSASGDVWALEVIENAVMNGTKVEHIKDAAQVLSRYCNALAIRSFAGLKDLDEDLREDILNAFKRYATVPVISLESSVEHPCQALADMLTIKERCEGERKPKFTLSWAPHIKPLPLAVPHSALLAGVYSGCDVTLVHPPGFELAPSYIQHARSIAQSQGSAFTVTNNQQEACANADVIYAKSWAPSPLYGDEKALTNELSKYNSWIMRRELMEAASTFLHCLPVRRNLEVADEVLDSSQSAIYDEAENRMWVQAAVLESIFTK